MMYKCKCSNKFRVESHNKCKCGREFERGDNPSGTYIQQTVMLNGEEPVQEWDNDDRNSTVGYSPCS